MNIYQLEAIISGHDQLRFTPAGIPLLGMQLSYSGEVVEAGINRRVEFFLASVAAGKLADQLKQIQAGRLIRFMGFMAPKSRLSKNLVFHINEFRVLSDVSAGAAEAARDS